MFNGLKVLFVEDDAAVRFGASQALNLAGFEVMPFASADAAVQALHPYFPGVLVADVRMPRMSGLDLLEHARHVDPGLPVILITGHGDISMAVQAMRAGAYDFIEKPFASDYLVGVVQRALEKRQLTFEVQELRRKLEDRGGIERLLLGQSAQMEELRRTILNVADTPVDVLIVGETGTGKELVAQCLHHFSRRRSKHCVTLNCGAVSEAAFDGEVLGQEPDTFNAAQRRKVGKMEYASGGTLFLDEVDALSPSMQAKLLHALQEGKINRSGSNEPVGLDARVVAATKADLTALSDERPFRSDLYYRISVVTLEIPPLRDRREDIPLLFEHFVLQAASRYGREAPIAPNEMTIELMAHAWPGNVRELRNVADRFVLGLLERSRWFDEHAASTKTLSEQVDEFEKSIIVDQLRRQNGNVAVAAETLAIPKKTLYDKIRKYGVSLEWFR